MGVLLVEVVEVVQGCLLLQEGWRWYLRRVAGLLTSRYPGQTPLLIFPSQMVRPLPSLAEGLLVFPMVLLVTPSTLSVELLLPQLLRTVKFLTNLMNQVRLLLMRSLLIGPTRSLLGPDGTLAGRDERAVIRRVTRTLAGRDERAVIRRVTR